MPFSSVFAVDRARALLVGVGLVAGALIASVGGVSATLYAGAPFILAIIMGILKTGSA